MIVFHSDIDNTLIYSYKHDIGPDKVGVEVYQDRVISFMTPGSYSLLKQVSDRMVFVPTTTRTREQYERIDFGIPCPRYALVCNGGILLEQGRENEEWYGESLKLVKPAEEEMELARDYLEKDGSRCFEVRNIRGLFLFTKSEKPLETVEGLKRLLNPCKVSVFHNGIKVYVVPKDMDKGTACQRLKKKLDAECLGAECLIAAGDSEFDVPMLKTADVALAPKRLCEMYCIKAQGVCDEEKGLFSDYVLEYLMNSIKERQ